MTGDHTVILVDNQADTKKLVADLVAGKHPDFTWLIQKKVEEFSQERIEQFIEEEERHHQKILAVTTGQSLKSMSSGERKKALLYFLQHQNSEVLIVINPYDSLDIKTQDLLKKHFEELEEYATIIQIIHRISDAFAFAERFYQFKDLLLEPLKSWQGLEVDSQIDSGGIIQKVPRALKPCSLALENLVGFKDVSVSFNDRPVLSKINWIIKKGEFWQLEGPNGSGKSTLLSLITGDSHKGYGQDLTLFGRKKGSGESVWDLKEMIGYFSPAMVDRFRGYHTLEHMLISGLHDSVGLYVIPSESEKQKAAEWLELLGLEHRKKHYFHQLGVGAKRLVMTARAMIKHPPLLILDEPTVGLDDRSAAFFVKLINTYAKESTSAVVFVSHRKEKGLQPNAIFELVPSAEGSKGFPNPS
ncbi:MAG: ATP-binding cassette domain-containing protein [Bacteroidota bacterium]